RPTHSASAPTRSRSSPTRTAARCSRRDFPRRGRRARQSRRPRRSSMSRGSSTLPWRPSRSRTTGSRRFAAAGRFRRSRQASRRLLYNLGMAILKVARLGHPVLRAKAAPVAKDEIASPRIQQLIDDMFETMHEYAGIGLAAPQVHEGVRVFVAGVRRADVPGVLEADEDMPLMAVINPEVLPITKKVV